MALKTDAAKVFKELEAGLIPPDETVRAVVRALPMGEAWRRSQRVNVPLLPDRPSTPIAVEGEAGRWPSGFARDPSAPDRWAAGINWFFWVVVTDKHLFAFEGQPGKGLKGKPTAGPESARYPLDRIAEISVHKGAISQISIRFVDGSSVDLEASLQKLDAFLEATRPFQRAGAAPRSRMGWIPRGWRWILGIAFLVLGMALTVGAGEEARTPRLLAHLGAQATATVWGVDGEGNDGDSAIVDVKFKDEFGLSAEATVAYCGPPDAIDVGDRIDVVYNPDDTSVAQFAECEYSTSPALALLIIGIAAILLGILLVLQVWRDSGWKRRRLGIPVALLGGMVVATSFTGDCYCAEMLYIGAALVIVGAAAQFGRARQASI